MSYFKINNYITLNKSHITTDVNCLLFEDIKKYMSFVSNNYNIPIKHNDINELIEIFTELNIDYTNSNISFSKTLNYLNKNFKKTDNDNIIYVSTELNKTIANNIKYILRVDNILDYKTIQYIYNLLIMYDDIIIYNCYITNNNDYRIYIICNNSNKERKKYDNINYIPYIFLKNIKTIYYQIIQNRINMIKKGIQTEKLNIWKSLYLEN